MKLDLFRVAMAALAALATACGPQAPEAARSAAASPSAAPSIAADGVAPALAATQASVRFTDVTAASGITFSHNNGAFGQRWLPETIGPGVVVLDVNRDGLSDLLFVNGRNFPGKPGKATTPQLYLNRGGMKFEDVTTAWGLTFSAYCLGGASGDLDNDGDADLYLSCVGRDLLLINDGSRFRDQTERAGLTKDYEFGASVALFDADKDGRLDIYATRYVSWTPETDLFCALDGKTKSYCTPVLYRGASPRFYRNRGDGTFEDRTEAAGLSAPESKTMAVVPFDLDDDGWTDLAVTGDTTPNLLYRNLGNGTFENIADASGFAYSDTGVARGGMGIDAADIDRSGRSSLVVSYFANEMVGLYQNAGQQVFMDVAPNSDVGRSTFLTLGWAALFFDYDLDGWVDLLVANGHLDEQVELVQAKVKYAQPQQLFRNLGGGRWADVTSTVGGDLAKPVVARGGAFADFDQDGDLDVVIAVNGSPAKLLENQGQGHGHWLRLSLEGTQSNRDGVGAKIKLTAAGATQTWQMRIGGSYLSQNQLDPVFGLGPATQADRIEITWTSGTVTTLENVAADRVVKVQEGT